MEKIKPTSEWMKKYYDYFNQTLFNGELGECTLEPFTSGEGSNGNVFGWFKVPNVYLEKKSGKMYLPTRFGREYINRNNFVKYCSPRIELNANYLRPEKDLQATLVHEMCHYYTYMNGIAPKQGHGKEFKAIGQIVSKRSNGLFTIQRLASAEESLNAEFTQDFIDKKKRKNQYILGLTLAKPIEGKRTHTMYNFGFAKISNTQKLNEWLDYCQNHKQELTKADLYECNNSQYYAKLRNANRIGIYYLTNDLEEELSQGECKLIRSLLENTAEDNIRLNKEYEKQANAYKVIDDNFNDFAEELVKAMANNTEYEYDEDEYYINNFSTKIKNVKVIYKNHDGFWFKAFLIKGTLFIYGNPEYYDYRTFATDLSYYYDGEYVEECVVTVSDILKNCLKRVELSSQEESSNNLTNGTTPTPTQEEPKQTDPNIIPLFRLKLGNKVAGSMVSNDNTFELRNVTKEELKEKLKERFPKMNDEVIDKLMSNPNNYPQEESKNYGDIVESVLKEFFKEEFNIDGNDDSIEITSDMNLGLYSPFEYNQ